MNSTKVKVFQLIKKTEGLYSMDQLLGWNLKV